MDTKERITKERTLQKSENKRAKLQKSESTKERIYKRANVTKERMLQKSEFYKRANFFKLSLCLNFFKCLHICFIFVRFKNTTDSIDSIRLLDCSYSSPTDPPYRETNCRKL